MLLWTWSYTFFFEIRSVYPEVELFDHMVTVFLFVWRTAIMFSKVLCNFTFPLTMHRRYNFSAAAAAAKSLQSCPTLCDPIDSSPSGSAIPGILQARTLEWVAISFSNAWKWKVKVKSLSRVRLFETLWTAAYQAPPSMGLSRQEYLSVLPLPSPE